MSLRYKNLAVALAALVLWLAACSSPAVPPTATPPPETALSISGSGSVSSVLTVIKPAFEQAAVGYNLNILSGVGTGGGVKGVLDGTLDVAAMARAPKDDETAAGLQYVEFGQTPVVMLLHPDIAVSSLSQEQVKAIFAGDIANWSEVGGPALPLVLYVRDEDDAATGALRQALLGDDAFPTTASILTSASDMMTAIESTPGSVGFGSYASMIASGKQVTAAALDDIKADDSQYPIQLTLGIGYVTARQAAVQPLIDWLKSEPGQTVLEQYGVQ